MISRDTRRCDSFGQHRQDGTTPSTAAHRAARLLTALCLAGGAATAAMCGLAGWGAPIAHAQTEITVNSDADNLNAGDRYCTLREAIMNANADSDTTSGDCLAGSGADIIILPSGCYTLTIAGTNEDTNLTGDLDITGTLTISGVSAGATCINANGIDRVFDIPYAEGVASNLVLSGMRVTNGVVGNYSMGGGIRSPWGADVTIADSYVISNSAGSNSYGGGLYHNGGTLTLIGAFVMQNTCTGTDCSGGGAYVDNAQASFAGGYINGNSAVKGGGLYLRKSQVTLSNRVRSNEAEQNGGGVYLDNVVLTQTGAFEIGSNDAADSGGGIYVDGGESRLLLGSAVITGNTAKSGGGLLVEGGVAYLSGAQLINNRSDVSGGGLQVGMGTANLVGVAVVGNSTDGWGGGIFVSEGTATLTRSHVVGNRSSGDGAGIYNSSVLTVTNSTLSGNKTLVGGGDGGGLTNDGGAASLNFSSIVSNTATRCAGGICMYGGGTVQVQNTLLASNWVDTTLVNCNESVTSSGHNLEDADTCGLSASGDITNTNPKLGTLMEMSGTLVHPLQFNSPAIDAGVCVAGIDTDQRGGARPSGLLCDIGAYEGLSPVDVIHLYLPSVLK